MQKGVGLYATCARCNNFGGRMYVPQYQDFTASVVIGLETWAHHAESAGCRFRVNSDPRVPGER